MNTRRGKVLSFSNAIACLALFIALGGTVYAAGKINGKQIKPRSLPGNRIKPRTIVANRIKPKSLTGRQIRSHSVTGRQIRNHSLTGDQIDEGTLTGISAAALADVQYRVTTVPLTVDSSAGTTATADCPAGTDVIGGGAIVSDEQKAVVNDSGPSPQQSGWTATGLVRSLPAGTMTITAICVVIRTPRSDVSSGSGSPVPSFPVYEPY